MSITSSMEDLERIEVGKSIEVKENGNRRTWIRTEKGFVFDGTEVGVHLFAASVARGLVRSEGGDPEPGDVYESPGHHYLILSVGEMVRYAHFRRGVYSSTDERSLARTRGFTWTRVDSSHLPAWYDTALPLLQEVETVNRQVRDLNEAIDRTRNEAREAQAALAEARKTTVRTRVSLEVDFPLESYGGCVCDQVTEAMAVRQIRLGNYQGLTVETLGCGRH